MKKEEQWVKKLRNLFEIQRQLCDGLAKIGGEYPEPEEQAISLFQVLLKQARQEDIESINEMKMPTAEEDGSGVIIIGVYNQALQDVISNLKKKGKK